MDDCMTKCINLLFYFFLIGNVFALTHESNNEVQRFDDALIQVLDTCTPGFHGPKHLLKPQDFLPCAQALKTISAAYEALQKKDKERKFHMYSRLCEMVDEKFKASEINIETVAKTAVEAGIITQEEYDAKKAEMDLLKK